jgi:hypothetical protein
MTNKRFFKYRPITSKQQFDFVVDILLHNNLHLSEARYFTDPFETLKYKPSIHKIISLTTSCDNILLWSFYASWHQGVMIEFEFEENCNLMKGIQEISYAENDSILTEELKMSNYYIKNIKYKFEEEWRYITDTNEKYLVFSEEAIKSVTFGASLDEQYKTSLLELCVIKRIKCFEYNLEDSIPQMTKAKRLLTGV